MFGIRQTLVAAAGILLLAGTAHAAEVFTITSPAFKDGTLLAKKNAGANKSNPNCVGENVSPPLEWTNVPAGTTSFALVMTDPEGRGIGTAKQSIYMGPCTPPGSPHHYTFVLIATDLDPKALPPGLTKLELFDKLNGHVKGSTGIIGLFKNPL